MPKKIFIIDDEPELVALLQMTLSAEGYEISSAQTAADAIARLRTFTPDLILMDVMLPDTPGTRLTGRLKSDPATASIPIIMLTAKDSATDVIVGLNMGADDYVTKPFSSAILIARIEAVLRRPAAPATDQQSISAAGITIFPAQRICRAGGVDIDLTPAEFRIMEALVKAAGDVVTISQLTDAVGLDEVGSAQRNIYVHVSSLRRKLGPARNVIRTVQRMGYRLQA